MGHTLQAVFSFLCSFVCMNLLMADIAPEPCLVVGNASEFGFVPSVVAHVLTTVVVLCRSVHMAELLLSKEHTFLSGFCFHT